MNSTHVTALFVALAVIALAADGRTVIQAQVEHVEAADNEAQLAGVMAHEILADAGYDARAMGQFFQKLEAQEKGGGSPEFFSNHPSPVNRIGRVNQEVTALGGVRRGAATSSRAFDDTRRSVRALSGPPAERTAVRITR